MLTRRTRSDLLDTRHSSHLNMALRSLVAGTTLTRLGRRASVATTVPAFEPHQPAAPIGNAVSGSGGFVAGFGEGEPLVAEVGDYLQAPAECLKKIMKVVPVVVVRDSCTEIIDTRESSLPCSATFGQFRASHESASNAAWFTPAKGQARRQKSATTSSSRSGTEASAAPAA